jgi:RNase P/RNase MRP subunit p30
MQKTYLAIDLRGYPSDLYEKVCQVNLLPDYLKHIGESNWLKGLCGVEIETFSQLKNLPKADVVFARGGTVQKNRRFLRSGKIDVLSCPYPLGSFQARLAAERKVALELCFREIQTSRGYLRARILHRLYTTVKLAKKYHAPLIITSGAQSHKEVVSPRQLVAFGRVLGLEYKEAKACIWTVPGKVLEGVE